MPLIENTLWGEQNKIDIAIKRLREFEPPKGYYLAFSGGKDSVTILRLAEMAGVQFDAHYNITTVDPPELVQFIKQVHPQVERHRPEMSMFRAMCLPRHFMPPMRQFRWCCELLKERGGEGRVTVTGIRWAESTRRKQRRMIETCYRDATKTYLHPIIDWKDADVWDFIRQENVPYCSLYDEGFDRLGCILCPMVRGYRIQQQIDRWPQFVKAYIKTFDRIVRLRRAANVKCTWGNGQEMFDWWIDRSKKKTVDDDQMVLFE